MARKKISKPTTAAPVTSYKHAGKRVRIPTQEESVKLAPRDKRPDKKKYAYDPSLDPRLMWAGKTEAGAEFDVSTVPIYVQEKIAPEALIARLKAGHEDNAQMLLFGETAHEQMGKAVDFYKHEDNWQNRMILGDSLLVMNSLLEKEGMRGRVQTVYMDPPYGIKFGSNWQVSTRKRDVKDSIDDLVRQPEQVKAFRDTWELGIHSYLAYTRDRLIIARELLAESGSVFIQISDANVHLVRSILDETFGSENFVSQINFRTAMTKPTDLINNVFDYILWYAKDKKSLKYRPLFIPRESVDGETETQLQASVAQDIYEFEYRGIKYNPRNGWRVKKEGMERLAKQNRLYQAGLSSRSTGTLKFIHKDSDFPYFQFDNTWNQQSSEQNKVYVVQTAEKIIKNCILLSSDPGDIILDPTCGSGTAAFVAEQWGRRWITTDTSRVALALARTRLMTAKFPYYKLKESGKISTGFEYKKIPHITLKTIANGEPPEEETLYDQPFEDKDVVRVTGPMTIESLSPHRISDAQEMCQWRRQIVPEGGVKVYQSG